MKLSIIILTWNSKDMVNKCLDSIYDTIDFEDFEIIVIDNGSKDGTQKVLKVDYPEIKIIQNEKNRGVGPARNQGLEKAQGEYFLILDIDTVVIKNVISTLIDFMDTHTDVGLCGPKLLYQNGELQYSCRKFPTVITKFLRRIPLGISRKLLEDEEYHNWDHNSIKEVDHVIGACSLIRKKAFEEIGYFDERIFYGPEDADYCLRLWKSGWKVIYNPKAVVKHYEQRITKDFFNVITLKHIEGLIIYFRKHNYYFSRKKLYSRLYDGIPDR